MDNSNEGSVIDLKSLEQAFKVINAEKPTQEMLEYSRERDIPIGDAQARTFFGTFDEKELELAEKENLTPQQWKLRELFRIAFEDEFNIFKDTMETRGYYVSIGGLEFSERLYRFPGVAENALRRWARLLNIDLGLFEEEEECSISNYPTGVEGFFYQLIHNL